jgi:hypothetical protein
MTTPLHFYHIGANSDWLLLEHILTEHFDLLDRTGFAGDYFFGIVGPEENRAQVKSWLDERGTVIAEADEGFEQVTLRELRRCCRELYSDDEPILYTHTKGAWNTTMMAAAWRQAMDTQLIEQWPLRLEQLQQVDAIGLHWLTQEENPSAPISSPFFGGNFWWANAGYLATLPEPSTESRHHAEGWLGLNNPRVLNLKPGWPVY